MLWVRWVRARGAESVRTGAVSCDPFTCSSYSTVRVCAVGCAMCIAFYSCSLPSLPSSLPAKDEIPVWQLGRYNVVMMVVNIIIP